MTLFAADFLTGHFLLFMLVIPCLIPGFDTIQYVLSQVLLDQTRTNSNMLPVPVPSSGCDPTGRSVLQSGATKSRPKEGGLSSSMVFCTPLSLPSLQH
jgi:hypothetical protein